MRRALQLLPLRSVPVRRGALRALLLGACAFGAAASSAAPGDGTTGDGAFQALDSIVARAGDLMRARHGDDPSLQIEGGALDPRLRLGRCPEPLTAELAPGSGDTGRVTVKVGCPAAPAWRVHVQLDVTRERELWALVRPVARGETLRRDMLARRSITLGRDAARAVGSGVPVEVLDTWLGYELVRDARSGQVLSTGMLAPPRLVRRGAEVRIRSAGRGLAIETGGVALADAALGERVAVRNGASGRVVEATVSGRDAVEIVYGPPRGEME